MDLVRQGIDLFLHLDQQLDQVATTFGPWLYVLMFVSWIPGGIIGFVVVVCRFRRREARAAAGNGPP